MPAQQPPQVPLTRVEYELSDEPDIIDDEPEVAPKVVINQPKVVASQSGEQMVTMSMSAIEKMVADALAKAVQPKKVRRVLTSI